MEGKQEILIGLKDIFSRWQALVASFSDKQIAQPLIPSTWTVKGVIAHLWSGSRHVSYGSRPEDREPNI
jgi:hypothetical protein